MIYCTYTCYNDLLLQEFMIHWTIVRPMKLDLQFLAQNSGKMMRAGGYYSLFIIAENC